MRLKARGVLYLFPHVIPVDAAGRLPVHNREQRRAVLAPARRVAPALKILPWVGGLRVGYQPGMRQPRQQARVRSSLWTCRTSP